MAEPRTIRTQFYQGSQRFSAGTLPRPERAPGQTLLRVKRVGICGTDLHIFQGHLDHRVKKGGIIGHETFAEVVEPEAGSAFRAGDRVVINPVLSCGTCRACQMGAASPILLGLGPVSTLSRKTHRPFPGAVPGQQRVPPHSLPSG